MAQLWPVFAVVAVWILVFVFCFGAYAKWLKVPTEMEVEYQHEAHEAEHAAALH